MLQTSRHIVGTQFCTVRYRELLSNMLQGLRVAYLGDHQDISFSLSSAPAEGSAEFSKCITKKVDSNDNASNLYLGHGHFESSQGP